MEKLDFQPNFFERTPIAYSSRVALIVQDLANP
jgi:hypothetical protein